MIAGGEREEALVPLPLRALAALETRLTRLEDALRRARKRARGEPLQVLVVLDWRLGDEVMALPVLEALKRGPSPVELRVRVRHPELLAGNPAVSEVNPLAFRPDLVLDLRGEVPGEARRTTLERKVGVELRGLEPRVWLSTEERERPPLPELERLPRPWVVIHPAASQACKSWGSQRWREVARALAAGGASIVEVGRDREALGVGLDLIGRTGVRELARTLALADVVLGDDSGPIHLALAVGGRAVAVFGSTDPTLLYPPAARGLVPLVAASSCRFCWPRRELAYPTGDCPLPAHECMESVGVEAVLHAARSALAEPVGAVL